MNPDAITSRMRGANRRPVRPAWTPCTFSCRTHGSKLRKALDTISLWTSTWPVMEWQSIMWSCPPSMPPPPPPPAGVVWSWAWARARPPRRVAAGWGAWGGVAGEDGVRGTGRAKRVTPGTRRATPRAGAAADEAGVAFLPSAAAASMPMWGMFVMLPMGAIVSHPAGRGWAPSRPMWAAHLGSTFSALPKAFNSLSLSRATWKRGKRASKSPSARRARRACVARRTRPSAATAGLPSLDGGGGALPSSLPSVATSIIWARTAAQLR